MTLRDHLFEMNDEKLAKMLIRRDVCKNSYIYLCTDTSTFITYLVAVNY